MLRSTRIGVGTIVLTLTAVAIAGCASRRGSEAPSTTSTTSERPSGATGAAPIVPFNPGERAGLGVWQFTLVRSQVGSTTTVEGELRNPGGSTRTAPSPSIFELVDLASRTRYVVSASTGLDAPVAARTSVPVTLTFETGAPPNDPVLAWKGADRGSVDAAFALRALSTTD